MYSGTQTFSSSGMAPFTYLSFQPFSRGSVSFYRRHIHIHTYNQGHTHPPTHNYISTIARWSVAIVVVVSIHGSFSQMTYFRQ